MITVRKIDDEPHLLLLKRSPTAGTYPNKWGNISGHIEKDETPLKAIRREAQEETGLVFGRGAITQVADGTFADNGHVFEIHLFLAHLTSKHEPMIKLSSEHTAFGYWQWRPLIDDLEAAQESGLSPLSARIAKKWRSEISGLIP